MHLAIVLLSLGLFCCIMGAEGTRCNTACTREYNPVCGVLQRRGRRIQCTFSNPCTMRVRSCIANERWVGRSGICAINSPECARIRRS
ncbi:hypothetical protein FF38_02051 [Lucilia cuprina]|uniref:Kazal-like domain-containing protein n=1 Tax=Lucilia cuprina TaxID=7375 RepID=A0A0L0BW52_LUCCU|nr:hypothetical protein CVS40_9980 [Lucilia cuprina]KNC24270.1 hypothetical protein FF38_02051 [Lucilia cuprina]